MSEGDSSQEKTEEPTPKRLEKSREDGQIPRSRELGTTLLLLGAAFGMSFFGQEMANNFQKVFIRSFSFSRAQLADPNLMLAHLGQSFSDAIWTLIPLFGVLILAVFSSVFGVGGWIFSSKAFMPKFSKLNPIKGLGRMMDKKALVELIKAILKVILLLTTAFGVLALLQFDIFDISKLSIDQAIEKSLSIVLAMGFALAAVTILIALIDVPFQIYEHTEKLKMTMQEIKDEFKDTEGKPEVKRKIRQLQQEMAQSRMMGDVPEADVVITNPTHYSIALKYDPMNPGAPVVVAKGLDFIALKIREIANEYEVEMVEAPPLARAIYYTTEINEEIPDELYTAVAQVLAYIFQLREFHQGASKRPMPLGDIDVPPSMQHD